MNSRLFGFRARALVLLLATAAGVGGAYGIASGADSTAEVRILPNPLTFDDVDPGAFADKTVQIKSTGTSAVKVVKIDQYGRDRTSFDVVSDTCVGRAIAPGGACQAVVRFKPTKAGTLVSTLIVSSSNACTTYASIAGGGSLTRTGATSRATSCEIVTNTETTTTPGSTTTTPGATTTTPGVTIVRPNTSSVASLTMTASKCSSRRTVTLHIRPARKQGFRSAKVTLNGKVVRRFGKRAKGKTITTKVVLKGKPRARFHVTINATGTNGKKYQRSQYFITCIAKTPVS